MTKENHEFNDIAKFIIETYKPNLVEANDVDEKLTTHVYTMPQNSKILDMQPFIDAQLSAPRRRKGTAKLGDLKSFIAHINRFKDEDSAIFADAASAINPCLTAILNYNRAGSTADPRFGDHRSQYNFPFSKEWKTWNEMDGKTMSQSDFAIFIEENINDILMPEDGDIAGNENLQKIASLLGGRFAGASKMMALSKGLAIYESATVENSVNLQSGEGKIYYQAQHNDAAGAPVDVPNMFMLAIPVFENGDFYRLAVRLRYRVKSGSIAWFYNIYQLDKVFDTAFKEAATNASTETTLPLFYGNPE